MKRIATFTTVWKRPTITSVMMNSLATFQALARDRHNIDIYPFFVLSANDPNKDHFLSIIQDFGWDYTFKKNSPLGDKAIKGLHELKMRQFDYLMHLDTDDIVSPRIFELYEPMMRQNLDWFGSKDKHIYDVSTGNLYYFEGYPNTRMSVNGGRTISRHALATCGFEQWTSGIEFGLNYHQKLTLEKRGFHERLISTKATPCILELKSDVNIHPIDWFKDKTPDRLQLMKVDASTYFDEFTSRLLGSDSLVDFN